MTWVKIEDTMPNNPKVRGIPLAARWAYISSICYAGRYHTNGKIPRSALPAVQATSKIADQLTESGLWEPVSDGWLIHDFLTYNRSKEQSQRITEATRKAGLARHGLSETLPELPANRSANGQRNALSLSSSVDPTPLFEVPRVTEERDKSESLSETLSESLEPWQALSQTGQDTFKAWAMAIGERFVFRPDSADMVLDMCQAVDELPADAIREAIRACRRDNVKAWPREVRARLPEDPRYVGLGAYDKRRAK